ncbi:MAG: 2-hydroxychromene-2-carboxylate isomerase [Oceanicoccus sp.]|jgi:2-hydroxychromene-2-carboxylate isomerase
MNDRTLHFYFDYLSPYAFFASRKLPALCARQGVTLHYCPVVFAGLLNHWGQLGPAEIPPKARHTAKQCMRYAAMNGISYNGPKYHPFNPLTSLRVSTVEVAGENQARVVDCLYSLGWEQGGDLGSDEDIVQALVTADIDGPELVARCKEPLVKQALQANTDSAIAQGVFGVPTMLIDDQLFWGVDQLDYLDLYLQGKDPIAGIDLDRMGRDGSSAWRPGIKNRNKLDT